MGGSGSGRHWQYGADTTCDYRSLDVRWMKREGLLAPGINRQVTWSRGGEVTGSIGIHSEPGRVILDYRHRDHGGEWQADGQALGQSQQGDGTGRPDHAVQADLRRRPAGRDGRDRLNGRQVIRRVALLC